MKSTLSAAIEAGVRLSTTALASLPSHNRSRKKNKFQSQTFIPKTG
jgi:hypothetical protein